MSEHKLDTECLHCAISLAVNGYMNAHVDTSIDEIIISFTQMLGDILITTNTKQEDRLVALGILYAASASQVFRDVSDKDGMQEGNHTTGTIMASALHALEDIGKRSGMSNVEIAEAQVDSFLRMAVCIALTYNGSHKKFLDSAKEMLMMMGDEKPAPGQKAH